MILNRKILFNIFLCSIAFFLVQCSVKENKDLGEPKINIEKVSKLRTKDSSWLKEIHMANLYIFIASESVKSKGVTAQVKNLADSLKINHAEKEESLQALAGRKRITLPATINNEQKRELNRLMEKEGILFCKEYVQQMEKRHQVLLKLCQKLSEKGEDAAVKIWADAQVPKIETHILMIEHVWSTIKDMKKDLKFNNNTYR